MKLKYPAEAFALGIVLFSAGMKEAFAAGILVIFSVVFAEFLKNLLEKAVPAWSVRACTYIATGSLCTSAFMAGFAALGVSLTAGLLAAAFLIGLLCAHHALTGDIQAEYGDLLWEAAIAWGFWILLAVTREFSSTGSIFGNVVLKTSFQSKALLDPAFAFIAAGLVLAFTNGVLKKDCKGLTGSLFIYVPTVLLLHPFTMSSFGKIAGFLWVVLVAVVLFLSVKKTLQFSRVSNAYKGLPADMLAAGFIYMILSIY